MAMPSALEFDVEARCSVRLSVLRYAFVLEKYSKPVVFYGL
jgi:hypothetical protein